MLDVLSKSRYKITKSELVLFTKIANYVLGNRYDLSLLICTDRISKHNVLAYALSGNEGEILINPSRRESYSIPHLFVHACTHLRGYNHGKAMNTFEAKVRMKFDIDE